MSLIKKMSEKIFGNKSTEIDKLISIREKAFQSQKSLQFKIAGSIQERKKIQRNLEKNEIRQIELQKKAKQFLLMSDENGAKIALTKKNLLTNETKTLNNSLESETKYLDQLKSFFAELETKISEMTLAINVFNQGQKQDLTRPSSSDLLSELPDFHEIERLAENILIKAKRDDFMRALEMDADIKLSNDNLSEDSNDLIEIEILDMKKDL